MGALQRFEERLDRLVNDAFAKAFRSAVQPVEIAASLQREVDRSAQILSRERRLAPNSFEVTLSPTDHERLSPYGDTLRDELIDMLRVYADEQRYVFAGTVVINFSEDAALSTGRFKVTSAAQARVSGAAERGYSETAVRRAPLVVDVNGSTHPLEPPGLLIGRGSEADLRISDPGVSRRHAEIRVQPEGNDDVHVTVVDLGSTNGMLVDGRRTKQAVLSDGTQIVIGNTTITVRRGGRGS